MSNVHEITINTLTDKIITNSKRYDIDQDKDNNNNYYYVISENGGIMSKNCETAPDAIRTMLERDYKDKTVSIETYIHSNFLTQEEIDEIVKEHNAKIA